MSMKKKRKYRGASVYIKTSKWGDGTGISGEINFGGNARKHVPQSDTVDGMMFKARRLIDAELDATEDVVAAWFKRPLV